MKTSLWGIYGSPYLDLSEHIETEHFDELNDEITRGLAQVVTSYTGGTLKWMGVVAPWAMSDAYLDAMHVVEAMTAEELREFAALSDDPEDLEGPFGDETDRPFTREQMRLLSYKHGVYFPWKVCYHFLENDRWEDKHSGEGKGYAEEALRLFPKTIAFIETLPFLEIGRAVLFGLEPNDHAPLHRDAEPGRALTIAQSISFAPRRGKRLYLQNAEHDDPVVVDCPIYWFNDMDYHGVMADPFFRYSIRVDGVLDPAFVREVERSVSRR